MIFFGKIFKNKQVVTIISLILCFGILVFAYKYRVDKAINAVSVPIATRTLHARELIDENCFETRKVAQSMLTKNVITNTRDLVGDEKSPAKYVNYNTFIPEGSMFYKSAVTTWDKMPDSIWADIKEGNTVIYLPVNNNTTYGNSIYPGDKIDLYYQYTGSGSKKFIGPLINGITVLAVKDSDGEHIFKKTADQRNAALLVFSVDDAKFLFLKRAMSISGGLIVPVPRNAEYSAKEGEETMGSDYIANFIKLNSKATEDDLVKKSNTDIKITE